jgi:hypothetical protein
MTTLEIVRSLQLVARSSQLAGKKGTACAVPGGEKWNLHSLLRIVLDDQVVLHAEHAGNFACAHARNLFVHRADHSAVEADVTAIYDDADRPGRIDRVLAQGRVAI